MDEIKEFNTLNDYILWVIENDEEYKKDERSFYVSKEEYIDRIWKITCSNRRGY